MDEDQFCKLLGIDVRTLRRWENNKTEPQGPALHIAAGIIESFERHPDKADAIIGYIQSASSIGGVAYLIIRLFDDLVSDEKWWQRMLNSLPPNGIMNKSQNKT